MPHVIEKATTGRAKCRSCGAAIAKDSVRVGEAVPNLFADKDGAEATHWHHPVCAAFRRPEAFLQAVESATVDVPDREALVAAATAGVAHHRLPRLDRAERAASARAACRACRTPIPKDAWRVALLFWEDGRFLPAGFIHAACAAEYAGTNDVLARVRHFSPALSAVDLADLADALGAGGTPPARQD